MKKKKLGRLSTAVVASALVLSVATAAGATNYEELEANDLGPGGASPYYNDEVAPINYEELEANDLGPGGASPNYEELEANDLGPGGESPNYEEQEANDVGPGGESPVYEEEVGPGEVTVENIALDGAVVKFHKFASGVTVAKNAAGNFEVSGEYVDIYGANQVTLPLEITATQGFEMKTSAGQTRLHHVVVDGKPTVFTYGAGEIILVDRPVVKAGKQVAAVQNYLNQGIFVTEGGTFHSHKAMTGKTFVEALNRAVGLNFIEGSELSLGEGNIHQLTLDNQGLYTFVETGKELNSKGVTRAEAFVSLASLLQDKVEADAATTSKLFSDVSHLDDQTLNAIAVLNKIGAVGGYKGKVTPNAHITNAQFAKVTSIVLEYLDKTEQGVRYAE